MHVVVNRVLLKDSPNLLKPMRKDEDGRLGDIADPLFPHEPRISPLAPVRADLLPEYEVLQPARSYLVSAVDVPRHDVSKSSDLLPTPAHESHHRSSGH